MATAPRPLDWHGYLQTPETMRRYDIVDGVVHFMAPGPDEIHQKNVFRTTLVLDRHVRRHKLGEVYLAPLDVIISKHPLRTRQPDALFVSTSRLHMVHGGIHGGPDLVVEILSPGNTPKKIQEKLRDYASAGVREAWVLNRREWSVTVLHPAGGEFCATGVYGARQRVRSRVLPRLGATARSFFSES